MKHKNSRYQNLPQIITDSLRESILEGELAAGSRLKQAEIAQQFEASLIPVREALRTLEQEGLVTLIPNKGAVVTALSATEVAEIFGTRIILELGALKLSIPHLRADDIENCRSLITQLDNDQSGYDLSRLNRELHTTLYQYCNNAYLLELIDTLHGNVERYMRVYLRDHYNNDLSQTYHRKIVTAATEGNIELACSLLSKHMEMAREDLVKAIAGE